MAVKNAKGFSLVELMITVAIIAVISLIAFPSYKSFRARARQKQGFALLNGYYAAAISARTEFGQFPGNMVGTGFAPTGELNYRFRADDNPNAIPGETAYNTDSACWRTLADCDCGGNCPNFKTWKEMPTGGPGVLGIAGVFPAVCGTINLAPGSTTDSTFVAGVAGWISASAATRDRYGMDETKTIEMCDDGLK